MKAHVNLHYVTNELHLRGSFGLATKLPLNRTVLSNQRHLGYKLASDNKIIGNKQLAV